MKPAQLPRAFQSLGALRNLNVLAVGLALAEITSGILAHAIGGHGGTAFGAVVGLPTLVCGILWALVLRVRTTVGESKVRWSWLASIPLAAVNAGLACGLMFAVSPSAPGDSFVAERIKRFLFGFAVGGSAGAFIWIPALILTLVVFGIPLWRSHALAARGLIGEERGERTLGLVATVVAAVGFLISFGLPVVPDRGSSIAEMVGRASWWIMGPLGVVTGVGAAVLASMRGRRRRTFIAEVAAGHVEGFRVNEALEGKVLVRITSMGQGYRVANFEEPVYEESADAPPPAKRLAR